MPVGAPVYPVDLVVRGRPCLVVGGGSVAARKAAGLVAAGARVHVVAPVPGEGVRSLAVTIEERPYRRGEVAGYRLAVAATDDPEVNRAVFEDGEAAGVWVNAAEAESCSFTLPAVARRGPITLAVSTAGASPAAARWLADRLAAQVGPEHEVLVALMAEAREAARADGRPTASLSWQKAVDSGILELIRTGEVQRARERLLACLSSSSSG